VGGGGGGVVFLGVVWGGGGCGGCGVGVEAAPFLGKSESLTRKKKANLGRFFRAKGDRPARGGEKREPDPAG